MTERIQEGDTLVIPLKKNFWRYVVMPWRALFNGSYEMHVTASLKDGSKVLFKKAGGND